jgi:C4-dicarboxylate-specific signal transduction histidine kinase
METINRLPDVDILHLTSLKEVFSGFAHEIAQPLHTILMASQVLQLKLARTALQEEEKEFISERLNVVTSQVQRASQIVQGLRAFGRGALPDPSGTDMQGVCRHIHGLMGQQFVGRGIQLVWNTNDPLPPAKEELLLLEGVLIQGLAYARDAAVALDDWHKQREKEYKKSVTVSIAGSESLSAAISWTPGEASSDAALPETETRPGLAAAASILRSMGGSIQTGRASIILQFP